MATDIESLLKNVMIWAPNAPEPAALRCLREAARDFCCRSRMWHGAISLDVIAPGIIDPPPQGQIYIMGEDGSLVLGDDSLFLTVGNNSSEIYANAQVDILEIEWASFDNRELKAVSPAELDQRFPGWAHGTVEIGQPVYISQTQPDTIVLLPPASGNVKARMLLQPSLVATSVPDFLAIKYADQLGRGAASKLLMLPGSTTEDPERAVYLERGWNAFLDRMNTRGAKGQQGTRLRVRGNYL